MKFTRALGFLFLAGSAVATTAFAATQMQQATLKDLQTVGSTTKKQKHQQYDLLLDAGTNEYTCRSKLGKNLKPTQFPVGSLVTFEMNGQSGKAINTDGNHISCNIVRVATLPAH